MPPHSDCDGGDASAIRTWSLFGFRLASDHAFSSRLTPARGEPDLTFRYVSEAPLAPGWDLGPASYSSRAKIDDVQSFLTILVQGPCTVFRFAEVVDFFIYEDRILCRVVDPAYAHMVEIHFLGFVMSYWLEARGLPAIHASAVTIDDHAIAFLSTNKGGKSSLAAGFMTQGHALLTDDILALEQAPVGFVGRPSYPQMRMWPEQAQRFVGTSRSLEQVHPRLSKLRVPVGPGGFGTFTSAPQPLTRLYVPERRDGGPIAFEAVALSEAVFELARHSFLTDILQHVGLHRERFALLADVARTVGLRRVLYPNGMETLPDVVEAIRADAAASS